ncbi:DICT sensory domain-containing protein [Halopenitus sp. H-Gu1]|uniref:DICT sensory domain-containing protein n=1 Tax=Halopenitus sp. H-Gu1 TaxID=3242697 RepID=UPI00359E830E
MADSLRAFLDRLHDPERSLVVLDRSSPEATWGLLEDLLANQPISVTESIDLNDESADDEPENNELEIDEPEDDVVLLLEDDRVLARSTMDELLSSILLINSDLYMTGSRSLSEIDLPEVIERLDDIPFRLRGYPDSNKEKLLLITVSRMIERTAAETGSGTLRSSFQRLSRIEDERGTRDVYETVSHSGADVHVYGIPDWDPSPEMPVTVHGGTTEEYRRSWFVVFTPEDPGADHVGLLALEDDRNVWDGFWTYRADLVRELDAYIETAL